jgi:hypothetical protein
MANGKSLTSKMTIDGKRIELWPVGEGDERGDLVNGTHTITRHKALPIEDARTVLRLVEFYNFAELPALIAVAWEIKRKAPGEPIEQRVLTLRTGARMARANARSVRAFMAGASGAEPAAPASPPPSPPPLRSPSPRTIGSKRTGALLSASFGRARPPERFARSRGLPVTAHTRRSVPAARLGSG